ncbi:MAG: sugar phosphate nucleotidyltransferase [Bacteroidota bacterium]
MIKGILLPSGRAEAFRPITYQIPVGLMPVVNKPLLEHQVELLVRNDVRQIRLSCNHLSNKIQEHFHNGARWGATISYNYERPPFGSLLALRQMKTFLEGATLIVIDSDVVADVDLRAMLEFHYAQRADATFLCPVTSAHTPGFSIALDGAQRIRSVRLNSAPAAAQHLTDGGICIIEPELLDLLPESAGYSLLQACWLASQKVRLTLFGYKTTEPLIRVANWKMYFKAQTDILERKFPGVIIPGVEIRKGIWVGRNAQVPGSVAFEGPTVIGDNCKIGKNVRIGKGTVIGDDVTVDAGTNIERTIVLPKTLVGQRSDIQNSIVLGNLLIDIQRNVFSVVKENLVLAEVPRTSAREAPYHFVNRVFGLVLIVAILPLICGVAMYLLARASFPLFSRTRRIGVDLHELSQGKLRLRVFDLWYLGPFKKASSGGRSDPATVLPRPLARLGNLINIITGDIALVGNRPMDPEFAFSITEEWQRTRFKCQAGFISLLDTIDTRTMAEEERSAIEGHYALHRQLRMDVEVIHGVVRRSLMKMFHIKMVPVSRHTRSASAIT